mgnify:FL=1
MKFSVKMGSAGLYKRCIILMLRYLKLLPLIDCLRYQLHRILLAKKNIRFTKDHPNFKLPPNRILYDISGSVDYPQYYEFGRSMAIYLSKKIEGLTKNLPAVRILEWGCGPARIIQWLPELFSRMDIKLAGADRNKDTIDWCSKNFPHIEFKTNSLDPPLGWKDGDFDIVYAVSVFTHLSEEKHYAWFSELVRLVKPGGFIIITVHGDRCCLGLRKNEMKEYHAGQLVVRGNVHEGKRLYTAYQSPEFMRKKLLKGMNFIDCFQDALIQQDIWVVKTPQQDVN